MELHEVERELVGDRGHGGRVLVDEHADAADARRHLRGQLRGLGAADGARRPVDEDEPDQVRAGLDGDREVVRPVHAADLHECHSPTSSWISPGSRISAVPTSAALAPAALAASASPLDAIPDSATRT